MQNKTLKFSRYFFSFNTVNDNYYTKTTFKYLTTLNVALDIVLLLLLLAL